MLRAHKPMGVIHFAAFGYVGESMSDPLLYYRNNVGGTMTLPRAMAAEGVERLVFSSICATYGMPETNPIREDIAAGSHQSIRLEQADGGADPARLRAAGWIEGGGVALFQRLRG